MLQPASLSADGDMLSSWSPVMASTEADPNKTHREVSLKKNKIPTGCVHVLLFPKSKTAQPLMIASNQSKISCVVNLAETKKQFVLVAFSFRRIGSQSAQPVCNQICCGFPGVQTRLSSIHCWEQGKSALAPDHDHRSNSTQVNTISTPTLLLTHETLVSVGVLCQNSDPTWRWRPPSIYQLWNAFGF